MGTEKPSEQSRPGLRERKKQQTRDAIAETAKSLFAQRGYDAVTVAEIADAANVSVKTLFKYFESKEDLFFENEDELCERILASVRERAPGESALEAVRRQFEASTVGRPSILAEIEGFRRTVEGHATLQSRLRRMWERYEEALAELLASETGAAPYDPEPRMVAAQLISLFRLLTSEQVRTYVRSHAPRERPRALEEWMRTSLKLVGEGVRRYAVRPRKP